MTDHTPHRAAVIDFYCGAGGASRGYELAGFDRIVGIDIRPQPNYPYEFHQADALQVLQQEMEWIRKGFDAIHASPPCQAYNPLSARDGRHKRLIAPTRRFFKRVGLPYVIENIPGAPLRNPIMLCGSSFGLRVRRHRMFECSFPVLAPSCFHGFQRSNPHRLRAGYEPLDDSIVPVYGGGQAGFSIDVCRAAMGIEWMTTDELNEAIPPAYTEFIGRTLLDQIEVAA